MTPHTRCTTDHDKIRTWIENHRGVPAQIPGATWATGSGPVARRIRPRALGAGPLEPLSWRAWFAIFDEHKFDVSLSR